MRSSKILLCITMIVGLGGVTTVAAEASTARSLSVTFSSKTPTAHTSVTVSGKLSKSPKGSTVQIQRKSGTKWSKVTSTKTTSSSGSYKKRITVSSTVGSYSYRTYAPKRGSLKAKASSTVKVNVGPPTISTTSLPNGVVGNSYSKSLTASGNATGTWSLTGDALPTGLSVTANLIHGTPAIGQSGTYNLVAHFHQTATSLDATPKPLMLTITAGVPPNITNTTLPSGVVGTTYSGQMVRAGSAAGTWSVAPVLHAGLNLNAVTGAITGTPSAGGTKSLTFTFMQTSTGLSDTQAISLNMLVPPSIDTTSLPDGALDSPYSQQLAGSSGTWSKPSGSFPAGITMTSGGLISGTPTTTTPPTASFTVRLTSGGLSTDKTLNLTVDPFIASTGLPAGTAGQPYSYQLQTNGAGTGTWTSFGGLPGLTLDSNGLLHGTPNSTYNSFVVFEFDPDAAGYTTEDFSPHLNIEGNLGSGPAHTTISAGGQSACRIKSTVASGAGTLWCWGANGNGQVDPSLAGASSHFTTPHQIGTDSTWTMVASSSFQHTCAVNAGHDLYCFGYNFSGQIGTGVQPSSLAEGKVAGTDWRFVSTGRDHTCAIRTDNSLSCWGQTIAIGTASAHHDLPTQVGGASWSMISAGSGHTCGIQVDATLWCWGSNGSGAVGDGTTTNVAAPTMIGSAHWLTVSAGNGFACAVKDDMALWCWGANAAGQLGIGSSGSPVTTPTQVGSDNHWLTVSAGGSNAAGFACGIKDDDTAWCWGSNSDGQLGIGNNVEQHAPTQVDTTTSWSSISAGGSTTCAVKNDESQRCWGSNGTIGIGQLGELGSGSASGNGSTFPVTVSN